MAGSAASAAASATLTAGSNTATPGTTGRFVLNTPTLDLQNGTLNVGTGVTTIGDGAQVTIERTFGTLAGAPAFIITPNVTYNGNANVTAGPGDPVDLLAQHGQRCGQPAAHRGAHGRHGDG